MQAKYREQRREIIRIKKDVQKLTAILQENQEMINIILGNEQASLPPAAVWSYKPAETVDELNKLALEPGMLERLKRCRNVTLQRTMYGMMNVLMTKSLASQFSLTGATRTKGASSKLRFRDSPAMNLISDALIAIPEYSKAPFIEIQTEISKYLKNATDKRKQESQLNNIEV